MSDYPTGYDDLPKPTAAENLDSPGFLHDEVHTAEAEAIEAVQATLGLTPQGASATVKARLDARDAIFNVPSALNAKIVTDGTDVFQYDALTGKTFLRSFSDRSRITLNYGGTNARVLLDGGNAITEVGLVVKGMASQSGNLTQWQNSAGSVLAKVESSGKIVVSTANDMLGGEASSYSRVYAIGDLILDAPSSGKRVYLKSLGGVYIDSQVASVAQFVVRGAAAQSANLTEWNNSSAQTMARVASDGTFILATPGVGTAVALYAGSTVNRAEINTLAAAYVGLVVKGATSQTADLQQWQNSVGAVLTRFNKGGTLVTKVNAAPVDGDLAAGECSWWFDPANGAAKAMFKGKTLDGTVVTASIPLA
jgi:hypothetical protein